VSEGNGQFRLQVEGDFGPDYQIQIATNLDNPTPWVTVFATNSPAPPFLWLHTNYSESPMLFYRAVLGP
jgi:hypothetical protein